MTKPFDPEDTLELWNDSYGVQVPTKPTCYGCHRELCAALDTYYGTDDYWGRFCVDCRDKRLPRNKT